jgi:DNA-directed RNA polymerase subunit RPC12/RpoP
MKYQCLTCKKQFSNLAKKTVVTQTEPSMSNDKVSQEMTESYGCPYCGSLDFNEVTEDPKQNSKSLSDITALTDCPHEKVNSLIAEGYQVYAVYQKNSILVKYRETSAPAEPVESPAMTEQQQEITETVGEDKKQ